MEKNFKLYDYKNKTVKQSEQTAETDFYGAFGWEPADISPAMPGSVTITFRRDRKAEHKAELVRLEKKAEGLRENGAKLKKERTRGASVFAWTFGSCSALLLGGGMFFCIVRLLLRLKKLETNDQLLVLLLVAMLAVCGISYTYFHEYYLYFWLMNMPVAIAVMAVELKTEDFRLPGARQLLGVVLAGCFTVCAVNTVRQEIENPYLAHKGLDAAADWLVDNGYTEGYATFWNGNAMTELTNGKLDVWTLQSLDEDYVPNWLQRKEHLTTDPQHPFLLIDTETDGPAESAGLVQNGECTEVYNDGRFVIYDFAGADAVHAAAK